MFSQTSRANPAVVVKLRKKANKIGKRKMENIWRSHRPWQNESILHFTRHAKEINTFLNRTFRPLPFTRPCAPERHLPIICRSTTANKSQTSFSCCLTHGLQRERCFTVKPQACKRSLCLPWGEGWNKRCVFPLWSWKWRGLYSVAIMRAHVAGSFQGR